MPNDTIVGTDSVTRTIKALQENGFHAEVFDNGSDALSEIKRSIPKGASVMNGASKTLEQIGFIDYLKSGEHGWANSHEAIVNEKDPARKAELRKQAINSDFYLGSVHALTEDGQMVIASNTGSQLPHLAFTSKNILLVVGAQKITRDLNEGLKRVEEYVVPLEDERAKQAYGYGTVYAKTLILHKENPNLGRNVRVLIVNESLGF